MADVETYGGKCPKCKKAMLQKGDDKGYDTWFSFDACPWCGFAYGSSPESETPCTEAYIWNAIFEHNNVKSREELIKTLKLVEFVSKEDSEFYPSYFKYTRKDFFKDYEKLNSRT